MSLVAVGSATRRLSSVVTSAEPVRHCTASARPIKSVGAKNDCHVAIHQSVHPVDDDQHVQQVAAKRTEDDGLAPREAGGADREAADQQTNAAGLQLEVRWE